MLTQSVHWCHSSIFSSTSNHSIQKLPDLLCACRQKVWSLLQKILLCSPDQSWVHIEKFWWVIVLVPCPAPSTMSVSIVWQNFSPYSKQQHVTSNMCYPHSYCCAIKALKNSSAFVGFSMHAWTLKNHFCKTPSAHAAPFEKIVLHLSICTFQLLEIYLIWNSSIHNTFCLWFMLWSLSVVVYVLK